MSKTPSPRQAIAIHLSGRYRDKAAEQKFLNDRWVDENLLGLPRQYSRKNERTRYSDRA